MTWKELAPNITRQRLVIEGNAPEKIDDEKIKDYLSSLSYALGMKTLSRPVTHRSDKYGWAGWIHWESSGAHFYAWDEPEVFFSVDIYTCKTFDVQAAVDFTREYFKSEKIVFKEV